MVVAFLAAGCGGSNAKGVLANTATHLADIHSGVLHMKLLVTPRATNANDPFGFEIDGPFTFGDNPRARIAYTQIANGTKGTANVVLDGTSGYVESNGQRRDLTQAQVNQITGAAKLARTSGASVLDVQHWVREASSTSCPSQDEGARCVSGSLDPVETVNGLLALTRGETGPISGNEADRLKRAVHSATFFLAAGKADKLLRELRIDFDLGLDVPAGLKQALGNIVGAKVEFRIAVDDPNG
jgi:hypothetical protein